MDNTEKARITRVFNEIASSNRGILATFEEAPFFYEKTLIPWRTIPEEHVMVALRAVEKEGNVCVQLIVSDVDDQYRGAESVFKRKLALRLERGIQNSDLPFPLPPELKSVGGVKVLVVDFEAFSRLEKEFLFPGEKKVVHFF